jgi:hypothetical protein
MKKKGYIAKDCWFNEKHRRCYNCGEYNHKRRECLKSKQFGLGNFKLQTNRIKRNHRTDQIGTLLKSQVKAKMVAPERKELGVNPAVIEDTFTIYDY